MKIDFKSNFLAVFAVFFLGGCAIENIKNLEPKTMKGEAKYTHVCDNKSANESNDIGVKFELEYDFESAKICYKIACEHDLGVACSNLGSLYQKNGDKQNEADILGLFIKACKLNSKYGCYNGANSYRLAVGVEHDFVKAIKLYEKACIELNHAKSCTNLGGMHQFSLGVEVGGRDVARKYYKMGCELGDEVGCKNLSLIGEREIKTK